MVNGDVNSQSTWGNTRDNTRNKVNILFMLSIFLRIPCICASVETCHFPECLLRLGTDYFLRGEEN